MNTYRLRSLLVFVFCLIVFSMAMAMPVWYFLAWWLS
jgi:hypothetical protein